MFHRLPLAVAVVVLAALAGRDAVSADEGWLRDLDRAIELGKETRRPLLVVFRCVP